MPGFYFGQKQFSSVPKQMPSLPNKITTVKNPDLSLKEATFSLKKSISPVYPINGTSLRSSTVKNIKGNHFSPITIVNEDSIVKKNEIDREVKVRRLTKKSYVLGITTLVATILFILWIITVPTAIICSILAAKRAREAIALMDKDPDLNSKYRKKAILGLKLSRSIYVLLLVLVLVATVIGLFFLSMYLVLFIVYTPIFAGAEWLVLVAYAIGVTAGVFATIGFFKAIKYLFRYRMPEANPS